MPLETSLTAADFLRARILDDYRREAAGHAIDTAAEVSARIKANIRRHSIGFAMTVGGGTDGHILREAQRYADHPDFDPAWQGSGRH